MIKIIDKVEINANIPLLIVLGSISAISLIFFGLRFSSNYLAKKTIQQFMKDPILRKKYSDLIKSEVILSNTNLSSILAEVQKKLSNIDLDIETLDDEEFLSNFRGIQLK